jgi:hypothetical protein
MSSNSSGSSISSYSSINSVTAVVKDKSISVYIVVWLPVPDSLCLLLHGEIQIAQQGWGGGKSDVLYIIYNI